MTTTTTTNALGQFSGFEQQLFKLFEGSQFGRFEAQRLHVGESGDAGEGVLLQYGVERHELEVHTNDVAEPVCVGFKDRSSVIESNCS